MLTLTCGLSVAALPAIKNLDDIAKDLNLKKFKNLKLNRKLKVAVLDNGFNGYQEAIGTSLPQSTVYHAGAGTVADTIETPSYHGLLMAQILADVVKRGGQTADYELHLFNTFGYTKFADAVQTVIREKFDVVLYSQVWEYGGNSDGKGFINALVNQAVSNGILWVNAAGNFGRLTRLAPVDGKVSGEDEWVVFKKKNGKSAESVAIECKDQKKEPCKLRLVLSWNDFKDDPEAGTDKDLDLFLYDKNDKLVLSSERVQKLTKDVTNPQASLFPRELIETKINPGSYKVRVKVKSKNFSASQDQLRVTVSGVNMELKEPSEGETLLPPADNPGVLVVGALDDPQTNVSKKLKRPDVYVKSLVRLKDGSAPFSTSNAAAMVAGVSVLQLASGTERTREAVLVELKKISRTPEADKAIAMAAQKKAMASKKPASLRPNAKVAVRRGPQQRMQASARNMNQGYSRQRMPEPYPQLYEEVIILEEVTVPDCGCE